MLIWPSTKKCGQKSSQNHVRRYNSHAVKVQLVKKKMGLGCTFFDRVWARKKTHDKFKLGTLCLF